MSKRAFDKIARGLNEVLGITKGEAGPAKLYLPSKLDVRTIRSKLDLSQEDFAAVFGFTTNQIKDWEQGRSRPIGGVRAYLMMIDADSSGVLRLLRAAAGRKAA
jgi:putative transcriptional regulator